MNQEIEEIIKKHLPAQMGDVLKQTLEQGQRDANTVADQNERIEQQLSQIKNLKDTLEGYKKFDERNAALEVREEKVKQDEINLKINTLEYQLASEKEKTEFAKNMGMGLVRNVEARKTIFDSETQTPYTDSNGTWHYPQPTSKSRIQTETKE